MADFNHVNDKITRVEVSVARVETTTEDSNKRLAEVQSDLKHAMKNWQVVSQAVGLLGEKVKVQDEKLTKIGETKADKDDLEDLRKDVEAGKKAFQDIAKKVALWVGAAGFAYVISKLGITIPKL